MTEAITTTIPFLFQLYFNEGVHSIKLSNGSVQTLLYHTRKSAPLRRHLSNSCRGLQPLAALEKLYRHKDEFAGRMAGRRTEEQRV